MTLIVSWIKNNKAHQCSDSRIMSAGKAYDNNNKLLSYFEGRILIGIAGSWGINGKPVPEYIKDTFPKSSDMDNGVEHFIRKFPEILAAHINSDMNSFEVKAQGVRITIIIEAPTEFIVYGIDIHETASNVYSSHDYIIKAQELGRGMNSILIVRGHPEVEFAFNDAMKGVSDKTHVEILRELIKDNKFPAIIGGKVFCQHKIHESQIEKVVDEISRKGKLQDYYPSVLHIVTEIVKQAFDIWITYVNPNQPESQTSVDWERRHVKININKEHEGLNLLWSIFHEWGHIIDGMPGDGEELSLDRELSAWLRAYDKLKELSLGEHRDSFIKWWNHCIQDYYLRDKTRSGVSK